MMEVIDQYGPLTITELARRTGVDKATVSRTVAACITDGWVVKADRKLTLGPRSALLGRRGLGADLIRRADPLAHAVAGITGLLTQALGLVGPTVELLASASGREEPLHLGEAVPGPVNATAAGKAIAAQLSAAQLDAILPPEPYPDGDDIVQRMRNAMGAPTFAQFFGSSGPPRAGSVVTSRHELDRQLHLIRHDGVAFDRGELIPTMACIAVPWSHPNLPATLACLGTPAEIAAHETLCVRCLTAATRPGASPQDVIAAAVEP